MKLSKDNNIRLRWFLTIIITTISVYLGFRYILPLILPFVFAYFIAWIIRPTTEFMYRKLKLPRLIGGTLSIVVLVTLIIMGFSYLCNTLMKQLVLFLKNIPAYSNILSDRLESICTCCDEIFSMSSGTVRAVVDDNIFRMVEGIKGKLMPEITMHTMTFTIKMISFIGIILIMLVAAVLITKDLPIFYKRYENSTIYKDIQKVTLKLTDAGIAYLRCQLIIMVIVAFICVLGLTLIKNDYALLLGIGVAIMDALPILGSGIVFIPWSIIMLINGNIYNAAILITVYLACQIIREVLEPKLIGNCIGIRPLFTLFAMYIGFKLFSIAGFILGPVGLIIIITIVKVINEKLWGSHHGQYMAQDIPYEE